MSFEHRFNDYSVIDRHDLSRDDPNWISERLADPDTGIIPSYTSRFPVDERGFVAVLSKAETDALTDQPLSYLFLGELPSGQFLFTADVEASDQDLSHWVSLRHIPVDDPLTNVLLFIQGLLNWFRTSRYCHLCGSALQIQSSGNKQRCSSDDCAIEIFPRINPAIIVLLLHKDKCLLAHARHFKGDVPMYSCVAGYMETGEDFEQTLRREVFEEVGLDVGSIDYLGNQSWPFPNSLMIGFHATSLSTETTFHDGEIEDARWFSREEIRVAVKNSEIRLPTPKSISYTLIAEWFDQGNDLSLDQLLNH